MLEQSIQIIKENSVILKTDLLLCEGKKAQML